MLRIGTFAGTVIVGLAFLVFAQDALQKGGNDGTKSEAMSCAALVRKALAARVDIPDEFRKAGQPVPMRLVLSYLDTNLAERKLPTIDIVVDNGSFRDASGDPIDVLESSVHFPPFHIAMTAHEFLDTAIAQIPTRNATYLIINGRVEITTRDRARLGNLLDQGIFIQFRELPLKLAIEEVGERAGVTIMIDPRCGAELNKPVTLQTQNDISPRGILSSWADIFELKLLVDEHRVLLMPRADYLKKLRELGEEAQLFEQIQKSEPALLFGLLPQQISRQRSGSKLSAVP